MFGSRALSALGSLQRSQSPSWILGIGAGKGGNGWQEGKGRQEGKGGGGGKGGGKRKGGGERRGEGKRKGRRKTGPPPIKKLVTGLLFNSTCNNFAGFVVLAAVCALVNALLIIIVIIIIKTIIIIIIMLNIRKDPVSALTLLNVVPERPVLYPASVTSPNVE